MLLLSVLLSPICLFVKKITPPQFWSFCLSVSTNLHVPIMTYSSIFPYAPFSSLCILFSNTIPVLSHRFHSSHSMLDFFFPGIIGQFNLVHPQNLKGSSESGHKQICIPDWVSFFLKFMYKLIRHISLVRINNNMSKT